MNINFPSTPVFGFETARCNATESRKNARKDTLRNLIQVQTPFVIDEATFETDSARAVASAYKIHNFIKVLAYIPLIGTLIGFGRIVYAVDQIKTNKFKHIARGCVEFLSIGFLLLIPDIYLTLKYPK